MIGKIPRLMTNDKAQGKPLVESPELIAFIRDNRKESNCAIVKAFKDSKQNISRAKVSELKAKYADVPKPETKEQKRTRHEKEFIEQALNAETKKEQKRIIKEEAKKQAKKTLMDRLQETVKGKDGQPINYNGEELTTEAMMDISLINQAKESPQANLYLRAQAMALDLAEQKKRDLAAKKRMIAQVERQMQSRVKKMRQALTDKGVYLNMLDTMIEAWGDAWSAKEIAKWQWKRTGGDTVEVQITAQAQKLERPNQHYETYRNALKAYNDADQKLRSSCSAYFKLAVGDSDEVTEADLLSAKITKLLSEE